MGLQNIAFLKKMNTRKNKQTWRKDIVMYFIMICLVFDCKEWENNDLVGYFV
jgi:hypothetical protein